MPDPETTVLFRKQMSISDTSVRNGTELSVEVGDIRVTIRQTTYEHDETKPLLLLEANCERNPPREVREWLIASLDFEMLEAPPDDIHEYLGPLMGELHTACARTFELLRWRTASDTPHSPYAGLGDYFSLDGAATWHRMGFRGSAVAWQVFGLPLNKRTEADLQELLRDPDVREPIGHVLYREADDSRLKNQRSSLVVGVAALETATKGLIADLVPGSKWLVENLVSPPVAKLLKDYLPTLPTRLKVDGVVHPPPKDARRLIAQAVEERNRVAHRGQMTMGHQEILAFLDAVQNTLYLLDFYSGHVWAWDLIHRDYRAELGT